MRIVVHTFVGIGAVDIQKLKINGYYTVAVGQNAQYSCSRVFVSTAHLCIFVFACKLIGKSVHAATRRTLLKIKGFSEIKVEKVKEAVHKCLVSAQPRDHAS